MIDFLETDLVKASATIPVSRSPIQRQHPIFFHGFHETAFPQKALRFMRFCHD
jgi:hypothetical protein